MGQIVPTTHAQRLREAKHRLHDALRPRDHAEQSIIDYLCAVMSTPGSLDTFVAMAERATGRGEEPPRTTDIVTHGELLDVVRKAQ